MLRAACMTVVALSIAAAAWADPRPVQPFEVTSYDGRKVSSQELKGRPYVLMFLSTDCPHCQESSMRLDPVYRELQSTGLEVVGLSLNRIDNAGLRDYATRFRSSFPIAISSRNEFSRISGVSVMTRIYYPYILFVDRGGIIQEEHQGSEQAWFADLEGNFRRAVEKLR